MDKKHRNEELNFLYFDREETEKRNKQEKAKDKKKIHKRADNKKSAPIEDNKFNFDNEIVIGVTKIPEVKPKKKKVSNLDKKEEKKRKDISNPKTGQAKEKKTKSKEKKLLVKLIKWFVLLGTICIAIILFLLSPVFNISKIEVENNSKITTESYISLSQIQLGENIFKVNKNKVIKSIKQNPYVEEVKVNRKLPDVIQLQIVERKATFAIEYASSYIYINNQGYILEVAQSNQENLPVIRSIKTTEEKLKVGNRLEEEDLEKLGSVLKIVEVANGVSIAQYITYIDIADKHNYVLRLEEKKKTIYLGDDSNLSNKMLYSKAIIEKEEGIEGNIRAADSAKGNVVFQFKE